MTVENREFSEDITQISMSDVPIVDRDSAVRLGNRKIGELVNLISQFEVDEYSYSYTQINYQGVPTRVAPLRYGDVIKWFNNRSEGIPGYISVNMTTQDVELVQLENGIKYSPGEYFSEIWTGIFGSNIRQRFLRTTPLRWMMTESLTGFVRSSIIRSVCSAAGMWSASSLWMPAMVIRPIMTLKIVRNG